MEHDTFKNWLWVNTSRPVSNLTDEEVLRYADQYAEGKAGLSSARIAELERLISNEKENQNKDEK